MYGSLSKETEVKVPAIKAWELYGTLQLGKIIGGKVVEAVEVVEGDGSIGTILKITLHPGSELKYYKEKFTKVDNDNKIKETEVVEGGYLDFGFSLFRLRFEIKENPKDETGSSCLVKCTVEYEIKEEFAANASFVTFDPLVRLMNVTTEHLLNSK